MKKTTAVLFLSASILNVNATEQIPVVIARDIANQLNNRYLDTSEQCTDGKAAYYCNGVLVRVADTLTTSEGEIERNAASFTYLRADTGITNLFSNGAGIVLSTLPTVSPAPIRLRCSFPTNAATDWRPDGCGVTTRDLPGYELEWSRNCDEQGIQNGQDWLLHFNKVKPAYFYMCAFRESEKQFSLNIAVRRLMPSNYRNDWNEVITTAWSVEDIKSVPFQAFFYNQANLAGKENAKKLQMELYKIIQTIRPIVRINLSAEDQHIFSYHEEDQTYIPIR
ncbi:hypothetical protein [Pseudomonas serbica]